MSNLSDKRNHFIRQILIEYPNAAITRFPPEPNGYLHIGHAKSICLNFGMAKEFNGKCFLRFDDTNPIKEEAEFVHAIIQDMQWLGFKYCAITYASDYYQQLYDFAVYLIQHDQAYVDSLSAGDIREYRGTLTETGRDSPYRNRSIAENLNLFQRMKDGEFADGTHVLRARIDMHLANLNLRDPVLYRIRHAKHQRTGDNWCIYPMYDYAHPISDALELITHSLCTLEFQDHRPLYDWLITNLPVPAKPIQIEFARLNLSHTITSKRKLRQLVEENIVSGWDDPRLPTLRGMRQRGYPPAAIRNFCEIIGISRSDSVIDMSVLEECVRESLNKTAPRALCVLDPLKVIINNYPEAAMVVLECPDNLNCTPSGRRMLPFTREIYIDRSDFMTNPPRNYYRLSKGMEVRLRHAYVIRCDEVIYDAEGNVVELHCTYFEDTLGRNPPDRKIKGVIQWVSCRYAHPITIYQYDRLFNDANPAREDDFLQFLNQNSMEIRHGYGEPWLANQELHTVFQFERLGYYCVNQVQDNIAIAYHRIVALRDTWSKIR